MNLRQKLVKIARKECKESNVKLYLGKRKAVRCIKILVNGFFDATPDDEDIPVLACATGRPNWELVLVHELSHLRQWRENCKLWAEYEKIPGNLIDHAISGKNISQRSLEKHIRTAMLLERDCEYRSYDTLKELGYPKNKLQDYVQKANAYTIFYLAILKWRKWYQIGKEPYNIKAIWSKFPTTFDIDVYATFDDLSHLYEQCI
jgi:hypothetical protein